MEKIEWQPMQAIPLWDRDHIQFARLLAEVCATQDRLDIPALADSMDLTLKEVNELFDRAQTAWERYKANPAGGETFTATVRYRNTLHDTGSDTITKTFSLPAQDSEYRALLSNIALNNRYLVSTYLTSKMPLFDAVRIVLDNAWKQGPSEVGISAVDFERLMQTAADLGYNPFSD